MVADYLDLVQKRLNITFERLKKTDGTALSWGEIQDAWHTGQLDVIASLLHSDERANYFNFTQPYIDFPWVFIAHQKTKHSGKITDFHGQDVAVAQSCPIAKRLSVMYPGLNIVPVDKPMQGLLAVAQGKAVIFVGNAAAAVYLIKKASLSQLKIAGSLPGIDSDLHMGVRKDWPILVNILNKALASLTPREKAAIHNSWISLDFDQHFDWKKAITVAGPAVLVVLVVIAVILIANRRLQKEVNRRKETEEALRESEAHSRHLLEAVGAGVMEVDTCGMLRFANSNALTMLGYAAKDFEGRQIHDLIHHTGKDGNACLPEQCLLYQAYAKEKEIHVISDIFWEKDGTSLPVGYIAKPVYKHQKFIGAVISFLDITERLQAEAKIRQSKEDLRFALETADAYYFQFDCKTDIITYSFQKIFLRHGYTEKDIPLTNEAFSCFVHPDVCGDKE